MLPQARKRQIPIFWPEFGPLTPKNNFVVDS